MTPEPTPDLIKAKPVPRPGVWVGAVIVAVLGLGLIDSLISNPEYRWQTVREYLFDPRVLSGVGWTQTLTGLNAEGVPWRVGVQRPVEVDGELLVAAGVPGMARDRGLDAGGGVVVEGARQGQGFTGVPEQREGPGHIGALQHAIEGRIEHRAAQASAIAPIGQVAVVAVEVAERGALHHQQAERAVARRHCCSCRSRNGAYQLRKPPRQPFTKPPLPQAGR